jgi:hypothetical protein
MPGSAVRAAPATAGDDSARTGERLAWRALLALDLAFFLTMSVLAIRAPCGAWANRVFGVPLWNNLDPGGPYVISSVPVGLGVGGGA